MDSETRRVPAWVAVSVSGGYPSFYIGMFQTRKALVEHHRTTYGRDLQKDGYRAVKATIEYPILKRNA